MHVRVVQVILSVVIGIAIIIAHVFRARSAALVAIQILAHFIWELKLTFISRLFNSSFGTYSRKGGIILDLVQNEEGNGPLSSIFIPIRTLSQFVKVTLVEHYLDEVLIEFYVLFLHADYVQKLSFVVVVFLGQSLDLLVGLLVFAAECSIDFSKSVDF